jgi:hypothetical protein
MRDVGWQLVELGCAVKGVIIGLMEGRRFQHVLVYLLLPPLVPIWLGGPSAEGDNRAI